MNLNLEMTPREFEEYLHDKIPMTEAMSFKVFEFHPQKVTIGADLKPNINHKSTAFGGSINSLATVCGWAIVFNIIKRVDPYSHIVIQKSSINYLKPISNNFVAICELLDQSKLDKFIKSYHRLGKARIDLRVLIQDGNEIAAEFSGHYVVFKEKSG